MYSFTLLMSSLLTAQAGVPAELANDAKQVAADNNRFALDLYQQLAKEEGNLFFSPFSVSSALAMTYGGAKGQTADEMEKALNFTLEPDRLHPAFGLLVRQINGEEKKRAYKLVTANRLWGQKDYGFLPNFIKLTGINYQAGLEEVDFKANPEGARKTINEWVEKQTQDKIKNLLPPGAVTPDSRMVLTNAIYFKAAWRDKFHERATQKKDFHGVKGKAQVDMMHKQKDMSLYQDDRFQLLTVPYERNELSMMILLPRAKDGLGELEKSLNLKQLEEARAKAKLYAVKLSLPKFKMTYEKTLNQPLQRLGMKQAFTRMADFSGIATGEKLEITSVVHKAFVDVNEEGTEAAAATGVVVGVTSAPAPRPPAVFNADHPFLFWIQDNRTGSVLFMGRVMEVN